MATSTIKRIVIDGYRKFDHLDIEPTARMNILVGDNESGKSTLTEAIYLALSGKINGRSASEELNPFWFHRPRVLEYFEKHGSQQAIAAPQIFIELHLSDGDDNVHQLRGVHNSLKLDCPGVRLLIEPNEDFEQEFAAYMMDRPPRVLPVEFYRVEWRDFSDRVLTARPKELAVSFIDSRTIRSTSGVDYHTREMLSGHLDPKERAVISLAHRRAKQDITDNHLAGINDRIAQGSRSLHDRPLGLQMDQSARTSWEVGIVPQVDDIPFGMAGQGQQAAVKVSLAMSRTSGRSRYVLIEEPENHLSHTSLTKLVDRIEQFTSDGDQQTFITTHSSFVLNRLGLDKLLLIHDGQTAKLTALDPRTVAYFRKLSGYDTLRLVLAQKVALVEGPSDDIVLQRAVRDATGKDPIDLGIDIISMQGLAFRRALEVCAALDRSAIAIRDNDGKDRANLRAKLQNLLADGRRELLMGDPACGKTLEPQLIAVNDEATLRRVLGLPDDTELNEWMTNGKTEAALRILDSDESIVMPDYINQAVKLLVS
ncbi:ATP-dependent endonuclease [Micromonospora sp. NPDC005254]|uniref:ATP-dependent nuclease n=1 Tax=Micromonospora sp. NPDC005254 TaxID=3364229 RepID=UPI00369CCBA8